MLTHLDQDIFLSPCQTLVNAVNTVGVMGKGIAADFKRRYPEMFDQYREHCQSGVLTIGKLWLYKTPDKWVLSFPTKKDWRDPSRLEYLELGLEKFAKTYALRGITSAAFPRLGCGNGNLQWDIVRPLMESYLGKLPIPINVHTMPSAPGP
jgi:O-acetyl-ADP-ribose deacetylase (regulator of RNase III)